MEIVQELPGGVTLSEHLRQKSPFYIAVMLDGAKYYIAATPNVRRLFELDGKGKQSKPDRRRRFDGYQKEAALRDIVSPVHLQLRDCVLAGIEDAVSRTLLNRMREVMAPTVRGAIEQQVKPLLLTDEQP